MNGSTARFISDAVNPTLIGCWSFEIVRAWRRGEAGVGKFAAISAGAVALTYGGAHLFRVARLWPENPLFPSGHETFAVSVVTSLVLRDARWLALTPLLGLLGYGLVRAGYHDWLDIGGAALLTPPIVITWHHFARQWTREQERSGG